MAHAAKRACRGAITLCHPQLVAAACQAVKCACKVMYAKRMLGMHVAAGHVYCMKSECATAFSILKSASSEMVVLDSAGLMEADKAKMV